MSADRDNKTEREKSFIAINHALLFVIHTTHAHAKKVVGGALLLLLSRMIAKIAKLHIFTQKKVRREEAEGGRKQKAQSVAAFSHRPEKNPLSLQLTAAATTVAAAVFVRVSYTRTAAVPCIKAPFCSLKKIYHRRRRRL